MKTKKTVCLLLCLLMLFSLSGCRYSDVLQKIIYNQQKSQEIDEKTDIKPNENNENNEEQTDDLKALENTAEADTTNDPSYSESVSGEGSGAPSPQPVFNAAGDSSGTAVTGQGTTVTGTGEGSTASSSAGIGSGTGTDGTGDSGTAYEPEPGADTAKEVVDDSGEPVEIPEGIDKIAATGPAALAVLIAGGSEALLYTDEQTKTRASQTGAFDSLSNTQALWQGNGTSAMSDENFSLLLASPPDAVIETSGKGTVSEAQAQQLSAAGIDYLAIPQMTNVDNIRSGMNAIASMLAESSDDAGSRADQFNSWLTDTTSRISSSTGANASSSSADEEEEDSTSAPDSKYTLYIEGWDAAASYSISNTTVAGSGMAYTSNNRKETTAAVSTFLSYANVINNNSQGVGAQIRYVSPILKNLTVTIGNLSVDSVNRPYYTQNLLQVGSTTLYGLGDETFPYIIVPDPLTKSEIEHNRDQSDGLWHPYGFVDNGNINGNNGFMDSDNTLILTQISGYYDVLLNPQGLMSSWTEGGPEMILESAWAAWKFHNGISRDQLGAYIKEFYLNFYGLELNDSQISTILQEG
ncbi:MAG: hypothetical protein IKD86_05765 [Firmicutes bacterium]|nr:hypothetical protein [Bacillota bacterium]